MALTIKKDPKINLIINLVIVQMGMFLLPIFAIPYIVHKVGIKNYGTYAFFQATMVLLSVIVNYGFIQTGVRDIAISKSIRRLNYEYSNIFYAKLIATCFAIILGLALFLFEKFSSEKMLYLFSFTSLLVNFLDVSFVYQGIQRLKDYVNLNLIGNVVSFAAIFLLIKKESDYIYLPLVMMVPRLLASAFIIYLLHRRFNLSPAFFILTPIISKLKSNFKFFISNIFSIIYTKGTIVLLGLITNNVYVGYYSIAEQLVFAGSSIFGKISAAYQPQIAHAFSHSLGEGVQKAKENIVVSAVVVLAGFLFTQFFSYELLWVLFKENAKYSNLVFKLLSSTFLTVQMSSIIGIQILVAVFKSGDLFKPSIYAALINLTFGSILIYLFKANGAALSAALVEVFMLVYLTKKIVGYGITLFTRPFFKKMGLFSLNLILILIVLRLSFNILQINILTKLLFTIGLYGLSVGYALYFLKIVDFRNRKILMVS